MNQSTIATVVAGAFSMLGIVGLTTGDVSGFINVCAGIVSLGAILWAHVAHKKELGRALGRY